MEKSSQQVPKSKNLKEKTNRFDHNIFNKKKHVKNWEKNICSIHNKKNTEKA